MAPLPHRGFSAPQPSAIENLPSRAGMGVDFAQTKGQRSPRISNRAKVAPDCHSMCPRARRRRHMVSIGTLSHRGFSPSAIVNRTPRVAMCANFAETKAQGSPRTLSRIMVALDRRSMGPRARSRRNMVRIGTPLAPRFFSPPALSNRKSTLQSRHGRRFRSNESPAQPSQLQQS